MNTRDRLRAERPFKPGPVAVNRPKRLHINTDWEPAEYDRLKTLAADANVSLRDFVKQAVRYAVDNMEQAK